MQYFVGELKVPQGNAKDFFRKCRRTFKQKKKNSSSSLRQRVSLQIIKWKERKRQNKKEEKDSSWI